MEPGGQRIAFVVEGRFTGHPVLIGRPGAKVDQTAALGAERTMRALRPPFDAGAAARTLDHAGLGRFFHYRLQKVILKNKISYCFL